MELHRIKVNIHRNIPVKGPVTELQRDIVNPEDVIVKRREGKILHFSKSLHFFKLLYFFTEIQLLCSIAKEKQKYLQIQMLMLNPLTHQLKIRK